MAETHAHDLDRKAAHHRSELSRTLGRLTEAVNPARTGADAVSGAASLGHDAIGTVTRAVSRNPVAALLVGAGAAMLLTKSEPRRGDGPNADPTAPPLTEPGFDDRVAAADRSLQREAALNAREAQPTPPDSDYLEALVDAGLEKLGPEARARIIDARRRAIAAQRDIERQAARIKARARQSHQDQPLMTGALALGIGAVIGGLLPSTKRETQLMGAKRDQLFQHAEALLHEELDQLKTRTDAAMQAGVSSARREFADDAAQ
ncbi:hypothetical protein [Pseudoponticoccus marisrubri]|uniref:DUF3618 domain-containing protein n=1 Tax=Pseudoponticoccus marisrubri TaxID=1685382 RepID=A0A0W7WJA8_9RHOB|nr:hypothetical protein [Pseudoponticoccus marisrubri]KUF10583.1 hypothetical protein AVJ23_11940 [Pseudoponticoccus marisrubri]